MKEITERLFFALIFLFAYTLTYGFSWAHITVICKRYVIVNNKLLRKLFINSSERFRGKYVKVEDRKKLSVYSLVLYIILAVILVMTIVMMHITEIPCEPFAFYVARRVELTIDSWNDKLPLLSICLFVCSQIISIFVKAGYMIISRKAEYKLKPYEIVVICAVMLFFLFCACWLLYKILGF